MWMGTKLPLLQESGQGRLGWQRSKPATAENITPAKDAKATSKMPPEPAEAWPRDTRQVSESNKNLPTMGGRIWKDWTLNII